MSLHDYMNSLRIPYEEIASATNNFGSENLIPNSSSNVKLYKGQLLLSGQLNDVVVHKFQHLDRFAKEVQMAFHLHQKDLAYVVAFSGNNSDKLVIVKKYMVNGSLDKHLGGSTLTWLQRLKICVGVSQALSCLHYNDVIPPNHYMLYGDIKCSKILLDDNWEPKLLGSQFSVLVERHRVYVTSECTTTLQYLDPAYETTGVLTHKSDVFSLGVLLFEVLFGKKAEISNNDNWCFARLARLYYEGRKMVELIDPDLRTQMDLETLNFYSETAYSCLKEDRQQRPDMKQVVKRLERALELQKKHQEQSNVSVETTPSSHLKGENVDHFRIPLSDIKLATKNFSETCCIGSGGYGRVYKGQLKHFDGRNSSATVAIKRIFSREDKQGKEGFLAEIEMLCNCKHPNIISLLGFCDEDSEMLLIYEYASNGSLEDYFGNNYNITSLTWIQRIQICLDIANGLNYLHTRTINKQKIIHRDIKSANILLDDNWTAKIADFGLSKLHGVTKCGSTLITFTIAGTQLYVDPEYSNTGKLKRASDIYSFGVVMFEILSGTLAYDGIYGDKGLPSIVRQRFHEKTLKEIVDPKLKEAEGNILILNQGLHQDSLDTFSNIAYQCLAETQVKRPTIETIVKELEKAHDVQTNLKDNLGISLKDIKLATGCFNDDNCIGEGMFWKLYEGEIHHDNTNFSFFAKWWDNKSPQGSHYFLREVEVLSNHKHNNIIGLVGYFGEMDEKIIVYEHLSNGRLDKHLDNACLTWLRRLKICIDVASGLSFLHEDYQNVKFSMIHRNIKSSSILLDADWRAKLYNMEFCSKSWAYESIQHIIDNAYGSLDYVDPNYKYGFLVPESDIYSLGVVLMEILCGRLAHPDGYENSSQSLGPLVKRLYKEGKLDRLVFQGIRNQIVLESLRKFHEIALQCLEEVSDDRPKTSDVVKELKIALQIQEDHEIWEPKLPRDYEEIFRMSMSPKMYFGKSKKDLYYILTNGILLQGGKVLFSLGINGERNEMISAKIWYKKYKSHNWQTVPTSRFHRVAKMLIVSKLKTRIKTRTQFLSPGVNYGVYLVFKFYKPRKVTTTPIYVNLKYTMGNETLHSYFATWRDDEWMMIELCQCCAHNKEVDFQVILESFSRYYCKSNDIYVEGIEFRAINKEIQNEEVGNSKTVQQELSTHSKDIPKRSQSYDEGEQLFLLSKVQEKKHCILLAKEAIYDTSNMKVFNLKPSAESRFNEVIEVLAKHVLHIKCKIESQMLSPNTEYACYLVFKLSEKCHGLHCPVILRDLLRWNNKVTEFLYFRSPSPINQHNINQTPQNREDGCMEVSVWKGNSNGKFENDSLPLNLKLVTYEGTMCGLIVYGLEFRPM